MNFKILYISGTGGTMMAAQKLQNILNRSGSTCVLYDITKVNDYADERDVDMLIVMYPVHAFGAPRPVYAMINKIQMTDNKSAAVISISAGGDVPSNKGCRIKAIKTLKKKNYNVIYEDMIMMPSNWAVKDPAEISDLLINVLDRKINSIGKSLLNGLDDYSSTTSKKIPLNSRIIAAIGTFSRKVGFPVIGKFYRANKDCTGCKLCAVHCPMNNINMINNRPKFGWKCIVCMRCIYGCPEKAISAGPFNFMIIDEGYDIKELTESARKSLDNSTAGIQKNITDISTGNDVIGKYINDIDYGERK